jgi:SAM-dependent methyltransferase
MSESFDEYRTTYRDIVSDSIAFSGLKHDFFMQAKADLIERRLRFDCAASGKPRALDIGCGIGTMHPYVRDLFSSIDGCDVSRQSIERARADNPYVKYRSYSGDRLPYDDGSFDFTIAVCVVHHVPPALWPGFFAEMKRVLRPGGTACVIEHNPLNPATRLAVLRCPFDKDAVLLRGRKVHGLFTDAGFTDVSYEYFLLLPSAGQTARRIERAAAKLPVGAQYACFGRV